MMDTEAFREFKTGLTLLREKHAEKALPHMRRAVDLEKNNPYYMSYLGVVLARSEGRWGEAERLCDSAVRMKRSEERRVGKSVDLGGGRMRKKKKRRVMK